MTVFIQDTSTQTTSGISSNTYFSTQTIPKINFNGTGGIYNPSIDNIRIFTNNTDALIIDNNQCLYGNGTGLTHLQYNNIDNKPSYFPSDYNSTIINTPNLSVYATNTNLNNVSTQSYIDIPNIKTTSTTIFTNVNSLSTNSILSINNLNATMNSIFSISSTHQLAINNLNATSTTIFTNLNSLSTNSILSINNLNATMNNIFSISSTHQLSINNLNATSTTIFTNLNSLSTNSALSINNLNATMNNIFSISSTHQLSINNLNATSTTIFTNLNSLSTNSILSINNLNATSTTLLSNINSLSTNSTLSINNLNATSTTLLSNINSLSTNSTLSINNLNATSTTILTNLNNLSTQSYLDIPNIKTTSTTILGNLNSFSTNGQLSINNLNSTMNNIFSISSAHQLSINNLNSTSTTILGNLNSLSSNTLLSINGASTVLSTLNVSGNTIINNTLNLSNQISGGNQLRIAGSSTNDGITNALSIGGYGMVGIDSPGIQYGRLKLDNSGNITCSGSINVNGGVLYINNNPASNPGSNGYVCLWNQAGVGPTLSGYQISLATGVAPTTERMRIDNSGNVNMNNSLTVGGTITNGSSSYIYAGGLRIAGWDTNTLYNGGKLLGITCDNGYNINFNIWGGTNGVSGNMMNINNTGITCNSTLTTRLNQNSLVSYLQPNPQNGLNNTTSMSNLPCINLCAGAYTTGNAVEPYLTVYCADSFNGFDTIVVVSCIGGANSGFSLGSRMILDGSYNTNSSRGTNGSYICWQSQTASGWGTNMELYTYNSSTNSTIILTVLNVMGAVKSNGVTLTSSENIKEKVRDIYSPLDLINSFTGKHYHNKLTGEKDFGLIAEDVEKLCPCLTSRYNDSGVDIGVKYMNLTAVLIEGIKAQQILINNMQTQINNIQTQINLLLQNK